MLDDTAEGGGHLISYAAEEAEGMYAPKDGKLVWEAPGDCNTHIEIAVHDKADGRLIPGHDVDVTVIDKTARKSAPTTAAIGRLWATAPIPCA